LDETEPFLDRLSSLLEMLLPAYRQEGKAYLTIALGCTGGRHRSVAMAEAVADRIKAFGVDARIHHRDVEK
ncbi:MAG TPA: RNase adapter RapZ, partial [Microthrixaceae bacterium]|nr:RNase adapter RapZ [Microthrixaceae bacterium]